MWVITDPYDIERWCASSSLVVGDGYLLECDSSTTSLYDVYSWRVVPPAVVVGALLLLATCVRVWRVGER